MRIKSRQRKSRDGCEKSGSPGRGHGKGRVYPRRPVAKTGTTESTGAVPRRCITGGFISKRIEITGQGNHIRRTNFCGGSTMLTYEKVLNVFEDYLQQDPLWSTDI